MRACDQLTNDCHTSDDANRPAFLYQLGDVVYDFGESKYYHDQFYGPFRNYPAPILPIPGNHDSFVIPNTPADSTPVDYHRGHLTHRAAMTQLGVYFTRDAPFVRIIGLFNNALEDPGVISSERNNGLPRPTFQLDFLDAQLARIKKEKYAGAVTSSTYKNLSGASGRQFQV